jgi:hypothetical protein
MTRPKSNLSLGRLRSAVAKGLAYLRAKQGNNGGFCFFKHPYLDLPNLRDSYHAATALQLWGSEVPRKDALVRFLKAEKREGVDALFYFSSTLQVLGVEHSDAEDLARIKGFVVPALNLHSPQETDRWLERTYRTLELRRRAGGNENEERLCREIHALEHKGGYGYRPNLRDTLLSLKILALLGRQPSDLEATRRFVDGLQHAAIGFTAMPGLQYGNLEILGAGIECCALIDLPIRYPSDALTYVLACQSADGSFSRVPVALPDIAYTHQALQVIAWLRPDASPRDCAWPHNPPGQPSTSREAG